MNNWKNTEASSIYKEALEAVKTIDPPAAGFLKEGSITQVIKQNNLLIQLLVKQSERLEDLISEVHNLKRDQRRQALTSQPTEQDTIGPQLEAITKKLASINLGDPQPSSQKKKSTPFYVFRDPKKIDEQEKAKLKG